MGTWRERRRGSGEDQKEGKNDSQILRGKKMLSKKFK